MHPAHNDASHGLCTLAGLANLPYPASPTEPANRASPASLTRLTGPPNTDPSRRPSHSTTLTRGAPQIAHPNLPHPNRTPR